MSYSTEVEVRKETGFSDNTKILSATVTESISSADGFINSKISNVYTIPLAVAGVASTPSLINELSKVIASAFLFMNTYGEESQGTDKGWEARLEWATEILNDIASKEVKLADGSGIDYDKSSFFKPAFSPNNSESLSGGIATPIITMHKKF